MPLNASTRGAASLPWNLSAGAETTGTAALADGGGRATNEQTVVNNGVVSVNSVFIGSLKTFLPNILDPG